MTPRRREQTPLTPVLPASRAAAGAQAWRVPAPLLPSGHSPWSPVVLLCNAASTLAQGWGRGRHGLAEEDEKLPPSSPKKNLPGEGSLAGTGWAHRTSAGLCAGAERNWPVTLLGISILSWAGEVLAPGWKGRQADPGSLQGGH